MSGISAFDLQTTPGNHKHLPDDLVADLDDAVPRAAEAVAALLPSEAQAMTALPYGSPTTWTLDEGLYLVRALTKLLAGGVPLDDPRRRSVELLHATLTNVANGLCADQNDGFDDDHLFWTLAITLALQARYEAINVSLRRHFSNGMGLI